MGCEELLGAWWQHGIHLVQTKIKFGGYTQRELIKPVIKPVINNEAGAFVAMKVSLSTKLEV